MIDLTTPIVPYKGTGIFELRADYSNTISILQALNVEYDEEILEATDVDPPWIIVSVGNDIKLFFAKDTLFKIVLLNKFKGELPNGISLDTSIDDAQKIDPTLQYDDWEEFFESANGYWLEENLDTHKLWSISIFMPEVERDDFQEYNW